MAVRNFPLITGDGKVRDPSLADVGGGLVRVGGDLADPSHVHVGGEFAHADSGLGSASKCEG